MLGVQQDALLSDAARRGWAQRGFPGLTVGHGRTNESFRTSGAGTLLDNDQGGVDILVDGPAAFDRLAIAGACWPSHSYGTIDDKTGKPKRGGRTVLVYDRLVAREEFSAVYTVGGLLAGNYSDPAVGKLSQPQGLPVRRSHDVECPVWISPHRRVLKVDVLLEIAARIGLDRPRPRATKPLPPLDAARQAIAGRQGSARTGARAWWRTSPRGSTRSRRRSTCGSLPSRCPMLAHALATGGAGDSEPKWHKLIFACAFDVDPPARAHALSRGDPRYTPGETDEQACPGAASNHFRQSRLAELRDVQRAWLSTLRLMSELHPAQVAAALRPAGCGGCNASGGSKGARRRWGVGACCVQCQQGGVRAALPAG